MPPRGRDAYAARDYQRSYAPSASRYKAAAVTTPRASAAAVRSRGRSAPNETRSLIERALTPSFVSAGSGLSRAIGGTMRELVAGKIEAGGTPVRDAGGMVIGVMQGGSYTGRPRDTGPERGGASELTATAAAAGASAPQPTAAPAQQVARRSQLAQQVEEENRRRRLAGMRRLGSRTLLSGGRLQADTLGA